MKRMIEMSSPLELFKQLQRAQFYGEDKELIELGILPPISEAELKRLQKDRNISRSSLRKVINIYRFLSFKPSR